MVWMSMIPVLMNRITSHHLGDPSALQKIAILNLLCIYVCTLQGGGHQSPARRPGRARPASLVDPVQLKPNWPTVHLRHEPDYSAISHSILFWSNRFHVLDHVQSRSLYIKPSFRLINIKFNDIYIYYIQFCIYKLWKKKFMSSQKVFPNLKINK